MWPWKKREGRYEAHQRSLVERERKLHQLVEARHTRHGEAGAEVDRLLNEIIKEKEQQRLVALEKALLAEEEQHRTDMEYVRRSLGMEAQ